jgi:poly(3-hydroxybutyrate) depolymerase
MLLKPDRVPKLPAPAKSPPPVPAKSGRWQAESMRAGTGHIDLAPWVPPERTYRIFVPAVLAPAPCLVLMLHGCRQTSEEIAEGTRLNEHAEERGWIVVYPEQTKAANKYNCWNWFDPANERGEGECAVVVAIHEAVRTRLRIPRGRTFLAGMSAGGALVSLLSFRYSRLWAGIGIHSGLPYGAARDPWSAQRAMRDGAGGLGAAHELRARVPQAAQLPAIVMHGNEDDVVHRRNADLLVRQFLGWNGYLRDAPDWAQAPLPSVVTTEMSTTSGHAYVLRDYVDADRAPVRECEVVGMGHAWSGGDSALPYHDEMGPDATALMMEFFSGVAER